MESEFLPNLFILGAAKCGTTTLHAYLDRMPDVCMSDPKEPFFFEAEFDRGLDFYRQKYFSHWQGEPVIGEARHRNLILPYVPPRIHQVNPNAKLIVLVRNPIDRAFSHWYHNYARDSEPLQFRAAIQEDLRRIEKGLRCDTAEEIREHIRRLPREAPGKVLGLGLYRTYLDSGYYYEQIERYLGLFPRKNLKVIVFEDMVTQPKQIIEELIEFLGLDPAANRFTHPIWENRAIPLPLEKTPLAYKLFHFLRQVYRFSRVNLLIPYRVRNFAKRNLTPERVPQMDGETRAWLRDHYYEHNKRLSEFLGRDLSSWV